MSNRLRKTIFWVGLWLTLLGVMILGLLFFLRPPAGRTNFLVLGVAGENHKGGDLTDSMIFLSMENQTGKTLIVSLPRDIWIAPLRTKLNTIYHYQGLEETKKIVGEILGQKVDYGVIVDFNLFTKMVDNLGGVEVTVERTFDDDKYPIAGKENDLCDGDKEYQCRYEHLHFDAGKQLMNGEQALKYVRSRNAEGEEGTDFARSQRQQRLLLAIEKKISTPRILANPKRLVQLIKLVLANIKTDISSPRETNLFISSPRETNLFIPKEGYDDLFKIALRLRRNNFKMEVLNDGFLINPPTSKAKYDNQWVLIPKTGDWSEIQKHLQSLL